MISMNTFYFSVNDTAEIEGARKKIKRISYLFVVGIPAAIGAATW